MIPGYIRKHFAIQAIKAQPFYGPRPLYGWPYVSKGESTIHWRRYSDTRQDSSSTVKSWIGWTD